MCTEFFDRLVEWSALQTQKRILFYKVSILREKDKDQFTVIDTEDIDMEAPVFIPIDPNQENDEEIKIV